MNKKRVYTWAIGLLVVLYLCVITLVFIARQKNRMEKEQNRSLKVDSRAVTESPSRESVAAQACQALEEKEAALQAAIQTDPQDVATQVSLAQLYTQQGKRNKAIGEYKKILPREPGNAQIHLALGQLYLGEKRYASLALVHLQKTLELEPAHPQRKTIELWIAQLRGQINQQRSRPLNQAAMISHLQKRLESESDPQKRKQIEQAIERLQEKGVASGEGKRATDRETEK